MFRNAPVCIFSFNRPDYLEQTLVSIKASMQSFGMAGPVILFQDGAYSPHTKIDKCKPEPLAECKSVFLKIIPHGVIFDSDVNLGIALNIYRAEKWVFETMAYDVAIFFEDDMVIDAKYFEALNQLNELALVEPRIGMFSAYGSDVHMSPDEQFVRRHGVGEMHHNWAFALRRSAWMAREAYTLEYMEIVKANDYRFRSQYKITSWYNKIGWPPLATNQDIAKNVILNHLGIIRITTNIILGTYIGKIGEHYTEDEFERLGFSSRNLFSGSFPDEIICLRKLSGDEIDLLWSSQRNSLLSARATPEQFLLDTEFSAVAQIVENLGKSKNFIRSGKNYFELVSGMYDDLWCSPKASLILRRDLEVEEIIIKATIASHLPKEALILIQLNGENIPSTQARNTNELDVSIVVPDRLLNLRKIISISSSIASDPFSAGLDKIGGQFH